MTPERSLPRSAPEAQGVASAAVLAFVEAADAALDSLHSLMLLRHGQVVAEGWWSPYAASHPHMLFSLSKSFTSTAAGLAIAEGFFTLDDPVLKFFADEAPETKSENLQAMKVRHLLSMSSGHDADTMDSMFGREDGNWAKGFLGQAVTHAPGTHFVYNSGATYMVSALVQKTTGKRALDFLRPRLFDPLGIENPTWEQSPQKIDTGGWGLSVRTEDIAKFGQLYLQKGVWRGKRLLPEGWVEQATAKHIANGDPAQPGDWSQGYGFQFWRCRHGAYRGDGAFGQFCVVFPDKEAVLALTSGVKDMQAVLNLVWAHLLPALGEAPRREENEEQRRLKERLGRLALKPPAGKPASATAKGQAFAFPANDQKVKSIAYGFDGDGGVLTVRSHGREDRIPFGHGAWRRAVAHSPGEALRPGASPSPTAAQGAWTDENTHTIKLCFVETPFVVTLVSRFAGDRVRFERRVNVGFGPTEWPALEGTRAA